MRAARLLPLTLTALLLVSASTGPNRPRGGLGSPYQASPPIGIHPGSPDANVLAAQLSSVVSDARSAGAKYLYFFRGVTELSDPGTDALMSVLGHPVAITVSVWNLTTLSSKNPAPCTPDWTTVECRTAIVSEVARFAQRYLRPGDMLFLGNEQNRYFESRPGEVEAHTALALALQGVARGAGVQFGLALAYTPTGESTIQALYDPRIPLLGLNAYGETNFVVGDPSEGITALTNALTFCRTLTARCGINETGWPTHALVGGSEAEQTTWASSVRSWVKSNPVLWLNVFIGLDGVLEVDGSTNTNSGDGVDSQPCWNAAVALGVPDPSTSVADTYVCSLGLVSSGGTKKGGWNALWGL